MPDRDWGSYCAVARGGLILVVVGAVALGVWAILEPKPLLEEIGPNFECKNTYSNTRQKNGVAPPTAFECIEDTGANREENTYAQSDLRKPATIIGAFRHFLHRMLADPVSFLTLVLAGSTIALWRSTRRLWQDADRQHAISNRAFVFLDSFDPDLRTGPPLEARFFAVHPKWRNSGSTPTKNMTIRTQYKAHDGELPDDFEYNYTVDAQPFFIGPGATAPSNQIEVPAGLVTMSVQEAQTTLSLKGKLIFFWGRADYSDVLDDRRRHFCEWCYRAEFSSLDANTLRVTFIQWGRYNRTDEDG